MNSKKLLAVLGIICFAGVSASFAEQARPLEGISAGMIKAEEQADITPVAPPSAGLFTLPAKVTLVTVGDVAGGIIGADGTQLNLKDENNISLGKISRELGGFRHLVTKFSDRPRMSIYLRDPDNNSVAYAYVNLTAWANHAITVDESVAPFSKRIGSFNSDVMLDIAKSLSINLEGMDAFFSVFSIYDSEGDYIARSVKSGDSTGFDFTIQRPGPENDKGRKTWVDVAHLIVNPNWQIEIVDPDFVVPGQPGKLDPRLLVMIPAFKHFVTNELMGNAR
ncbi:MAG: hypothetical protein NTX59_00785 [Elusimicrobia bacterium]|nr:hypothetical protein [Elusimicrobiota bacterium]